MMMMPGGLAIVMAVAVGISLPAPVTAQDTNERGESSDAAGRWEARWAPAIRTERDGSVTVRREADAVLVLEASGDSLVGTWTFELAGTGRSTWHVRGRLQEGRLALVAAEHETEKEMPPGQGQVVRQEWYGAITHEGIVGEHWMVIGTPGGEEDRSGPRPWSAVRVGG